MQIALHLGVNKTDEDRLVRCLMRNRSLLAGMGIAVPAPGGYRQQLRQLAFEMRSEPTSAATQDALLDGLIEDDDIDRVVLSSEFFLAVHRWAIVHSAFYGSAGERVEQVRHLFPEAEFEIYLAIRNPATFLPALAADPRAGGPEALMEGVNPLLMRWSTTISHIVTANPGIPVTVWTEEDVPALWPEILNMVSGYPMGSTLSGWQDWYEPMLSADGMAELRREFPQPPAVDGSARGVLQGIARRHPNPGAVPPPLPMPYWTPDYCARLTDMYEADLDMLSALPGVTLLEA
ncbi:MAG: hypothetical protein R3D60_07735 [Paracoccaceae bacterium]